MQISEIKQKIKAMYPDYNDHVLDGMIDEIEGLPATLRKELENFLATGEHPKTEVEGYSFQNLLDRKLTPIAAILTLGWLLEEPEKAKKTIERGWDDASKLGSKLYGHQS